MDNITPRIYVTCLASYNAGKLHGCWIDATQDADEIMAEIRDMLADSPEPNAEEWAIYDYEGFGCIDIDEFEDVEYVAELARCLDAHGEAFELWFENGCAEGLSPDEWEQAFEDAYLGEHEDKEAYAESLYQGLLSQVPEPLKYYIDWSGVARDLELSGDVWFADSGMGVYVYANH